MRRSERVGTADGFTVKPRISARSSPPRHSAAAAFSRLARADRPPQVGAVGEAVERGGEGGLVVGLDDQRPVVLGDDRRRRRRPRSPPPAARPPSPRPARSGIARCPTTRRKCRNGRSSAPDRRGSPASAAAPRRPRARASAAIRSLSGPSPTITSRAALWVMAAKARTSRGRFLTARSPATVPITTSPGLPLEARDRARLRAARR